MFNFFESIANLISTVVGYVVSFFTSLIVLIVRAVQALAYIILVIGFLPSYVKVFVLGMISVSVILFLINKGSD